MKHWQILSLLLLSTRWLPASAQVDSVAVPTPHIYTVVEKHPEFPGGMYKLDKYFRQNLHYPKGVRKAGVEGKVFVNFVVTDVGVIEDVNIIKSLGPEFDAEAIRVMKDMPRWTPGQQGGKPVYCRYNLPIRFY